MPVRVLIFVPTFNERENAPRMCEDLHQVGVDADVLFMDDNSPDGTGELLEGLKSRFPRLVVHHCREKLGIGSAHAEAVQWAYDNGYHLLVTMDCDFTHSPADIPRLIGAAEKHDVVVGSRWAQPGSLPGWNLYRRSMTLFGHLLTRTLLGIPQDATGAFRAYRLDRIHRGVFRLVRSRGYSFFFESLFVLRKNGSSIGEVPIVLPARTYGSSKMTTGAAWRSARFAFELFFVNQRRPEEFLFDRRPPDLNHTLIDPQDWDTYWNPKEDTAGAIYELAAGIYRRVLIKRNLDRVINGTFKPGAKLLHAGCGSGQVDTDLQETMRITGLDISPGALRLYSLNNPAAALVKHGSLFDLPFSDATFDGIYNLGVMEHFLEGEIEEIFREFRRVLEPSGKLVISLADEICPECDSAESHTFSPQQAAETVEEPSSGGSFTPRLSPGSRSVLQGRRIHHRILLLRVPRSLHPGDDCRVKR